MFKIDFPPFVVLDFDQRRTGSKNALENSRCVTQFFLSSSTRYLINRSLIKGMYVLLNFWVAKRAHFSRRF